MKDEKKEPLLQKETSKLVGFFRHKTLDCDIAQIKDMPADEIMQDVYKNGNLSNLRVSRENSKCIKINTAACVSLSAVEYGFFFNTATITTPVLLVSPFMFSSMTMLAFSFYFAYKDSQIEASDRLLNVRKSSNFLDNKIGKDSSDIVFSYL